MEAALVMIDEGSGTRKVPPLAARQVPPVRVPLEKFVGVTAIWSVPLVADAVPVLVIVEPVTNRVLPEDWASTAPATVSGKEVSPRVAPPEVVALRTVTPVPMVKLPAVGLRRT